MARMTLIKRLTASWYLFSLIPHADDLMPPSVSLHFNVKSNINTFDFLWIASLYAMWESTMVIIKTWVKLINSYISPSVDTKKNFFFHSEILLIFYHPILLRLYTPISVIAKHDQVPSFQCYNHVQNL